MGAINEAEDIQEALKATHLPETVQDISFRLDVDSSGWPAVWVWVILEDAAAISPDFPAVTARIHDAIRDALQQAGIERWPYVRFRTRSEQAEIVGKAAR